MRQWTGIVVLLLVVFDALAGEWKFGDKIPVSPHTGQAIFHQLDGTARKHIAVSDKTLAIVWSDNHEGESNIYAAFKSTAGGKFGTPIKLNEISSAFSPVVAA